MTPNRINSIEELQEAVSKEIQNLMRAYHAGTGGYVTAIELVLVRHERSGKVDDAMLSGVSVNTVTATGVRQTYGHRG